MVRRWALTLALACGIAAPAQAAISQRVVPMPEGVCDVPSDPSTPVLAGDGGRRIAVHALLRGGVAAGVATSGDRGRTFAPAIVDGASACTGGPGTHAFLVNPRAAMGRDGRSWFGSSWGGTDGPFFAYGVEAFARPGGVARIDGSAQDIAPLPVAGGARLLWTAFEQVPNPATYAPTSNRLDTAVTAPDGSLGETVTAYQPPAEEVLDDPSLSRAGRTLVAVASQAPLTALLQTLNPLTEDEPVTFTGVTSRSTDGGATWTTGGESGRPELFAVERDGVEMFVGLSDVGSGPKGRLVRVYARQPVEGRGAIVATVSDDAGLTWSAPEEVVSAPVIAIQPAVDVLAGGRIALSWYDGRADKPGDGRFDLQPRAALIDLDDGRRRGVSLGSPFDIAPLQNPGYAVDNSALGVTQDVIRLRGGFATVHTEPDPDATTRVIFTRVRLRR